MEKPTEPPTEVTADDLAALEAVCAKLRGWAKTKAQDHAPSSDAHYHVESGLLDTVGRRLEDVEKEKVGRKALMQGTDADKAKAVTSFGYLLRTLSKFTAQTEEMLRNLGPNPVTKASEEFSELLGKLRDSLAKKKIFDAVKSQNTLEYNMSKLDQVWRDLVMFDPKNKDSKTKKLMRINVRDNLEEFQAFNKNLRLNLELCRERSDEASERFAKERKKKRDIKEAEEAEKAEEKRKQDKYKQYRQEEKDDAKAQKAEEKQAKQAAAKKAKEDKARNELPPLPPPPAPDSGSDVDEDKPTNPPTPIPTFAPGDQVELLKHNNENYVGLLYCTVYSVLSGSPQQLQLQLPHPSNGVTVIVPADQVRKMGDDEEVVGDNTSDVDEDKTAQTKAAKKAKADAKKQAKKELKAEIAALEGLDKATWDALCAWRKETAQEENKGEFQVLYDKVMLQIARVRPTDPPGFGRHFTIIEGFGDTKQEQYGKAICTVVKEASELHRYSLASPLEQFLFDELRKWAATKPQEHTDLHRQVKAEHGDSTVFTVVGYLLSCVQSQKVPYQYRTGMKADGKRRSPFRTSTYDERERLLEILAAAKAKFPEEATEQVHSDKEKDSDTEQVDG